MINKDTHTHYYYHDGVANHLSVSVQQLEQALDIMRKAGPYLIVSITYRIASYNLTGDAIALASKMLMKS